MLSRLLKRASAALLAFALPPGLGVACASPATPPADNSGEFRVLFMHVDFPDAPGPSSTDEEFVAAAEQLDAYWRANSSDRARVRATVTKLLRMPCDLSDYNPSGSPKGGDHARLMADALDAAEAAGYDIESYDIHSLTPGQGTQGVAGKVWGNDPNVIGMITHEFGHALNLPHANSWRTKDGTTLGEGFSKEYGNRFDAMGAGKNRFERHFNVATKHRLGWLKSDEIETVTQSGVYRIQASDCPANGMPAGLRIYRNDHQNYWVEFRALLGDAYTANGALVLWENTSFQYLDPEDRATHTILLDMHPDTVDIRDAPLQESDEWFVDPIAGIMLRVLGKASTTPESMAIQVELLGELEPIDVAPTVTLIQPADSCSAVAGTTVFEARAMDPDAGEANGAGIRDVVFEVFGEGSEAPLFSLPPISAPPYRQAFDTTQLKEQGYTVLCRARSIRPAGGGYATELAYVRVRNQGFNRPPQIVSAPRVNGLLRDGLCFEGSVVLADPNGLEDLESVQGYILTPIKTLLASVSLIHEGQGLYASQGATVNFPTPGPYLFAVIVRDKAGATEFALTHFTVL